MQFGEVQFDEVQFGEVQFDEVQFGEVQFDVAFGHKVNHQV